MLIQNFDPNKSIYSSLAASNLKNYNIGYKIRPIESLVNSQDTFSKRKSNVSFGLTPAHNHQDNSLGYLDLHYDHNERENHPSHNDHHNHMHHDIGSHDVSHTYNPHDTYAHDVSHRLTKKNSYEDRLDELQQRHINDVSDRFEWLKNQPENLNFHAENLRHDLLTAADTIPQDLYH